MRRGVGHDGGRPGEVPSRQPVYDDAWRKAALRQRAKDCIMIGRLSRLALRFARIRRGTYIAVAGEETRRVRYTITRQSRHRWRAERADQEPGGGWVVSDVRTAETLKATEEWCEDCARMDRALRPPKAR